MNHSFDVDLAVQFGIEEAIIIENLAFWIKKNVANNKNFIDGKYWTFNSARAFNELFPYMNPSKINRVLKKLEKDGIIEIGNHNKAAYDKTSWYTIINQEILDKYKINIDVSSFCKMKNGFDKTENGFCNLQDRFSQNEKPIPDINTDINTNKKTTTKDTKNYKESEIEIETKDSSSSFLSENLKELKKYLTEHIQDIPTCKNIMFLVENRGLTLERIQTVVEYSKKNTKGNGYIYSALENNWDIPTKKAVIPSPIPTKKKQTLGEQELKDSLPSEEREYKELEFKTHNIIKKQPDLVKEFYKIRNLEQLKQFVDKNNIKVS
ncbi:hypothetical protein VSU16_04615 [Cetobacterium somerae]|uniref:hypothetical protein n=1 Tax=Cetobacterium somerae TaxID=188913 RepID=UPI002E7B56ED|nr:hypothetical protein [Cetobacterium somerae]WVJ02026.1 hypothetical protein VSU16_04615 [Cetobacterium somerae]